MTLALPASAIPLAGEPALIIDSNIDELAASGFVVIENFFDPDLCRRLAAEAVALDGDATVVEAGIGRGRERTVDSVVRRALIRWLDGRSEAQQQFLTQADAIRSTLNRTLYLGLRSFEAQLALTPRGGFYDRHLDSFHGNRNRVVSLVMYLTEAWLPADGGQLRIWPAGSVDQGDTPGAASDPIARDVEPQAGTLVLMLSEQIPHAVLPTKRPRASLAGWFRADCP